MEQYDIEGINTCTQALRAIRTGQDCERILDVHALPEATRRLGLEVVRLAEWLELRFAEFDKLQSVMSKIGRGLAVEQVLDSIYDTFASLIPYDRIGCALLDDAGIMLRSYWARADYPEVMIKKGFSATISGSSLEEIITTGKPRIINDLEAYLQQHPKSHSTRLIVNEGIRSSLTCPLIAGGKPIGFLFFSSCAKNTYGNQHQDIYLQTAGMVSLMVEKSLLYQRLSDQHSELQVKSELDPLTGVLNRGAIMSVLDAYLHKARHENGCVGVIMADLDHFKRINDTYGHQAGDTVLRAVTNCIRGVLRGDDRLGRYGGEEFLIVLYDADAHDSELVAERVREAVSQLKILHEAHTLSLSMSLGVACSQNGEGSNKLIARADAALYDAKGNGRNRVVVGEP